MLNPDGVVTGCTRCGLAGVDLNRVFAAPHKNLHPTIFHLKQLMYHLRDVEGRRIEFYFDFHGHSKKEGVFFYGNHIKNSSIIFSSRSQTQQMFNANNNTGN